MERYLRRITNRPVLVILLIALVTAVLAWPLPNLRFKTSIYDLTIEDLPQAAQYEDFKKQFGSEEIILVAARSDDFFAPEAFERLDRLTQALAEVQGVRRVISLTGIKRDIDLPGAMSLEEFRQALAPVDLFPRTVLSADGRTAAITLMLEDVRDKDPVIAAVRGIIEKEKAFDPYQIGLPLVAQALALYTEKDFLTLPPVAFLVILVVLLYLFRSFWGMIAPVVCLLTGLVWTFGLMAWTDTPLSMLTMIVPIFLIAVGTAYCMHVQAEYRRIVGDARSGAEAAARAVGQVAFPTGLAVVTTVIGLTSLLVNHIPAIRSFAVFAAAGIGCMLIIILTLMPAILTLLPLPTRPAEPSVRRRDFFDRFLDKVIDVNVNRQKLSLPLIALVALAVGLGITQLRVESNPVQYFKRSTPISRHFHDIYRDMSGSIPINVTVSGPGDGYFQDPAHLAQVEKLQKFLAGLDGVDKTESFVDYLKLVNYATNQYQPEFYALPEEAFEVRMLTNNFQAILGYDLFQRFMDTGFSKANIVLRTHISSSRDCLITQALIDQHLTSDYLEGLQVDVTGFGMVMAHSSFLLTRGQVESLSITLVLIFLIMFFLFLSLKVGIIALLPNLFPIIMNFGLMGWLGLELSAATSLIASVAIGLAVDDTIHYLFRCNVELRMGRSRETALRNTIEHVGRPIVFTTITISLGFAVLLYSSFQPTSAFGLMMVVTMFSALFGDLFLLPALMLHARLVTVWDILRIDPDELFVP